MRQIVLILFCLMSLMASAQWGAPDTTRRRYNTTTSQNLDTRPVKDKEPWIWKERLFYGGNVGFWAGSGSTYLDLSPIVGVKLNDRFSVGLGAIYNLYSYKYGGHTENVTLYGGRVFARAYIYEGLFAQVGWDHINRNDPYSIENRRLWIDNLLVGGGYAFPIGERSSFVIMAFYNVNETDLSPYSNPIIQMGVNIGF